MLVCIMYVMCPRQFQEWEVPTVVGGIIIVGGLIPCALLHSVYDLKVAKRNMQYILIQKHMIYECELDHNATKESRNICCAKGKVAVDHNTIAKLYHTLQKYCKFFDSLEYIYLFEFFFNFSLSFFIYIYIYIYCLILNVENMKKRYWCAGQSKKSGQYQRLELLLL